MQRLRRQAHREHRALACFARHRHVGAHHVRELARERKAEPGAPERRAVSESAWSPLCITVNLFADWPVWVMCGRRLIDKSFLTLMQHWSGAVMCPACRCGT